mmetsp:Transcript_15909/g.46415  ORF Transcript_15909/g.46415 Transcript_15909/m.46415 type:complete len:103 (+) Transcript_15909:76-384(+)
MHSRITAREKQVEEVQAEHRELCEEQVELEKRIAKAMDDVDRAKALLQASKDELQAHSLSAAAAIPIPRKFVAELPVEVLAAIGEITFPEGLADNQEMLFKW